MRRALAAWLLAACLAAPGHADNYLERMRTPFPIPDHYQLINDYTEQLLISRRVALEKRLQALEQRNGTQIVFLSVPNTGKDGALAYAQAVFQKWDIGNNGQGNGILFLMGNDDLVVLTGAGISGAVPDVLLARIRRNLLLPASQRNALDDGVEEAIDLLIQASLGEATMGTNVNYAHQPELSADGLTDSERQAAIVLAAVTIGYASFLLWRRRRS